MADPKETVITEEQTEEVVVDEDTLKDISGKVKEALTPEIKSMLDDATKGIVDKIDSMEEVNRKAVEAEETKEVDAIIEKGIKAGDFSEEMVAESKEMRLFKAARAVASGDTSIVRHYNMLNQALRTKAGYANTDSDGDGGALVPDPEFDTTVYENLAKYGVAFQYADVRQTERNAVRFVTLNSGLEFIATNEAGVKASRKLDFTKQLVELQKYAVIVPSTDELTDDAAIDFWNLVTRELSRAYAKKADEVTFTDATSGITNTSGVLTRTIGAAGSDLDWDDLIAAEGKPEDDFDSSDAKWFMRRETWFTLVQKKDSDNRYLFQPDPHNPTTPWGTPVVFTRVLPTVNSVSANDALAVYGNLGNYVLYNKRGMAITKLTEATILDSEGVSFNLATQDGTALRAVIRMLGKLPKGNAGKFVVIGTGTVS